MTEYSGWLYTDATNLVECPKCGAKGKERCRTPKGRKTTTPHSERTKALLEQHPEAKQAATRKAARPKFLK